MIDIEAITELLAPHTCLFCKREGSPLCRPCAQITISVPLTRCYRCYRLTPNFTTCALCRHISPLGHVWACSNYDGVAKQTVALLKFQRVKTAANTIADWLHTQLPDLPPEVIVTTVPTTAARVRLRGYDQARLIARRFAKKRGLPYLETLRRIKNTRQVGADRSERFNQLDGAFNVHKPDRVAGKHLLLVDDVLTTGATLESAAHALTLAGVGNIDAAVFSHAL